MGRLVKIEFYGVKTAIVPVVGQVIIPVILLHGRRKEEPREKATIQKKSVEEQPKHKKRSHKKNADTPSAYSFSSCGFHYESGFVLSTSLGYIAKSLLALIGNVLPVASFHLV